MWEEGNDLSHLPPIPTRSISRRGPTLQLIVCFSSGAEATAEGAEAEEDGNESLVGDVDGILCHIRTADVPPSPALNISVDPISYSSSTKNKLAETKSLSRYMQDRHEAVGTAGRGGEVSVSPSCLSRGAGCVSL